MRSRRPRNGTQAPATRKLPVVGATLLLALVLASPCRAADTGGWSFFGGVGAVDQEAIGGTASVILGVERELTPLWSVGLAGGRFGKKDCCGSDRDTRYGDLFASVWWPRTGARPFAQVGAGRYTFENHDKNGWFVGVGVDVPLQGALSVTLTGRYHTVGRFQNGALPDFKELGLAVRFRFY